MKIVSALGADMCLRAQRPGGRDFVAMEIAKVCRVDIDRSIESSRFDGSSRECRAVFDKPPNLDGRPAWRIPEEDVHITRLPDSPLKARA
jgi:hypothetical protein